MRASLQPSLRRRSLNGRWRTERTSIRSCQGEIDSVGDWVALTEDPGEPEGQAHEPVPLVDQAGSETAPSHREPVRFDNAKIAVVCPHPNLDFIRSSQFRWSVSANHDGSSIERPTWASNKAAWNTRNTGRYNRRPNESCVVLKLKARRRTDKAKAHSVQNRPLGVYALRFMRSEINLVYWFV